MNMMKRMAALLCAASLLLAVGCSEDEPETDNPSTTTSSTLGSGTDSGTEAVSDDVTEEEILESLNNGIIIDAVSENAYKGEHTANPLSSNIFCADPTAIEYNGRLYVYGTNDQQVLEDHGTEMDYGYIKSLVVFSTDDMVNWIYHGRIEVGEIAPWIYNSWAPSICSRVEDDGLTHFYLYFSNGGAGVGVITSTDPVTGWTDPLGEPFVYQNMPGLENCPAPFDPGVCIDENGVGWLSFGGGAPADGAMHSNIPKIVKLGEDMLSFDSEFVSIDAPYFFEASELNYIDGTYYYSYCTDWGNRDEWDYEGIDAPPSAGIAYMTTKTPLDADSWEFIGTYFYNAGQNAEGASGFKWSNNHTHFLEFNGVNYIVHHTQFLEELMKETTGFRSIMVDYLPMDTTTGEIPITAATKDGVKQIKLVDPYVDNNGGLMCTSADIGYDKVTNPAAKSLADGAWVYVRGVDFGYGASDFTAEVKGTGRIEVRLDDISSEAVAFIEFDCDDFTKVRSADFAEFEGRNHDVYFVFSGADIELKSWIFTKGEEELRPEEDIAANEISYETVTILGQAENPYYSLMAGFDVTKNGDYSVKTSPFDEGCALINMGFIESMPESSLTVKVNSITFETANGEVEVPVDVELLTKGQQLTSLANGWGGFTIGTLIYGTEDCGIFAEATDVEFVGSRMALKVDGEEVPFTSMTYNVTVSGFGE